ncbi:MAG: pyridoxal phosphate-dependent aminotransferase, partial [Myxococcales bacterium]
MRAEISRSVALVQHYPDPNCRELVAAIALADGASADQVVVGNGSSELLSWLPHAAQHPRWVVAVPSFGEYRRAPALANRELLELPLTGAPDFGVDWAKLDAALSGPSVVVLGHPNNPTGRLLPVNEFYAFRERHPECLFVVDEAFGDFVTEFISVWDRGASNLVVLRSLTKILAIPGLRLGYALTSPSFARGLRRYLPPWSVNVLAQRVGIRFFSEPDLVTATRQQTERLKAELVAALSGIAGLEIHTS